LHADDGFKYPGYSFLGGALGVARKTFARMTETAARFTSRRDAGISLHPLDSISRAGTPSCGADLKT
jgi:hypothetical protein